MTAPPADPQGTSDVLNEVRRSGPPLRECPSCGKPQSDPQGPTYFYSGMPNRRGEFVVVCCKLGTDSDILPENVAAIWNRRAPAETPALSQLDAWRNKTIEECAKVCDRGEQGIRALALQAQDEAIMANLSGLACAWFSAAKRIRDLSAPPRQSAETRRDGTERG